MPYDKPALRGEIDATFSAWHARLVLYGQVLLQAATGEQLGGEDMREPVKREPWTGEQEAQAWRTHEEVTDLEPAHRFAIQTFYRGKEAAHWDEYPPLKQSAIEADMCREFNAKARRFYGSREGIIVRQTHFRALRMAAVIELIKRSIV